MGPGWKVKEKGAGKKRGNVHSISRANGSGDGEKNAVGGAWSSIQNPSMQRAHGEDNISKKGKWTTNPARENQKGHRRRVQGRESRGNGEKKRRVIRN